MIRFFSFAAKIGQKNGETSSLSAQHQDYRGKTFVCRGRVGVTGTEGDGGGVEGSANNDAVSWLSRLTPWVDGATKSSLTAKLAGTLWDGRLSSSTEDLAYFPMCQRQQITSKRNPISPWSIPRRETTKVTSQRQVDDSHDIRFDTFVQSGSTKFVRKADHVASHSPDVAKTPPMMPHNLTRNCQ